MATKTLLPESRVAGAIETFVKRDLDPESLRYPGPKRGFPSDPVWRGLRDLGTEIWLDTGDLEGAASLWRAEMSALTTNNTLLYNEVKKGIYDELATDAFELLRGDLEDEALVIEISFILNARHGLRLVERFGARVSVELHTAVAHDVEGTLAYARRFHRISPDAFIVKIPFTPAGLIATRTLRAEDVPINMTLGFSARQNYLAATLCTPNYLNVFLGRLNSYVEKSGLGSGRLVGEKVTRASQLALRELNDTRGTSVKQIAASLRDPGQVGSLAGVDVHTIPLPVATGVIENPPIAWVDGVESSIDAGVDASDEARAARFDQLWEVDERIREAARGLDAEPPSSPDALIERLIAAGVVDLFPRLSPDDLRQISDDGKMPIHDHWKARIASGELAVDALLNLAGLASFANDQAALDERVRGLRS